jgi:hypothetical protein
MSFDAGSIKGSIDLDTSKFTKGIDDVTGKAREGAGNIDDSMDKVHHSIGENVEKGFERAKQAAEAGAEKISESVEKAMEHVHAAVEAAAEAISEALGPVIGEAIEKLGQLSGAFEEGILIGGITAVGVALAAVSESVEIVSAKFHQMGLEAEKAGVDTEFLGRLAAVGGTVGVGLDQLGVGFKILEQRAEEAGEGNKAAAEGFERLGISVEQAGELAKDPQRLFEAVQASIAKMQFQAERGTAALGVMGRQGANLVPLFMMGREEFDRTADTMQRMGGVATEQQVRLGETMGKLEGYIAAAMQGIEASLATPVLEYLQAHFEEIVPKIEDFSNAMRNDIAVAWAAVEKAFTSSLPTLKAVWNVVSVDLKQAWKDLQPELENVKALFASFSKMNLDDLLRSIHTFDAGLEKIIKTITVVVDQLAKMTAAYTDALGITDPNVRDGHVYNTKPGQTTQQYLDEKANQSPANTPAAAPGGPRADTAVKDVLAITNQIRAINPSSFSKDEKESFNAQWQEISRQIQDGKNAEAKAGATTLLEQMNAAKQAAADMAAQLEAAMSKAEDVTKSYNLRPDVSAGLNKQYEATFELKNKGDIDGALKNTLDLLGKLSQVIGDTDQARIRPGATPIDLSKYGKAPTTPEVVPDDDPVPPPPRERLSKQEQALLLIPDGGFLSPESDDDHVDRAPAPVSRGRRRISAAPPPVVQRDGPELAESVQSRSGRPPAYVSTLTPRLPAAAASPEILADPTLQPATALKDTTLSGVPYVPSLTPQLAARAVPVVPELPRPVGSSPARGHTGPPRASGGAGDQQVGHVTAELATTLHDLIAPVVATIKSFEAVTVSSTALRSTFDGLSATVSSVTSRLATSGRSAGQDSPPAHVTQNVSVSVLFDPRDSVNQLAQKLQPQFQKLKADLEQKFSGAASAALVQASTGD